MLIGYARVSTQEQNLERQIDALSAKGVDTRNIYNEKMTGTTKERPMLLKMISELKEGDTVVVSELTRLSRSTTDLIWIVELIEKKKANLKSLKDTWLDTSTATGKLMFTFMAGIAQFERDLLSERTKEGLESAKARGRLGGRPKVELKNIEIAFKLYDSNQYTVREIEEMTGVTKPTLYRYLKERSRNKM